MCLQTRMPPQMGGIPFDKNVNSFQKYVIQLIVGLNIIMLEALFMIALWSCTHGSFNASDVSKLQMDPDTAGCDSRRHVMEIPLSFHDPPFSYTGPITIGHEKFNVIFDSGSEAIWVTSRKLNKLILSNETIVDYMQRHNITIGTGYSNPVCSNQIEPYISAPLNRIGEAISCCCNDEECICGEDPDCDCSCCMLADSYDEFLCLILTNDDPQDVWAGNNSYSGNDDNYKYNYNYDYNYTSFDSHRECDTITIKYTYGSVESVVLYDTIKFHNRYRFSGVNNSVMYGNLSNNINCMGGGKNRKKSIKCVFFFFCFVLTLYCF